MNVKLVRNLLGLLMLMGLGVLVISCGMIESPAPSAPVATISPPIIPHSIEGRADCRLCHAEGIGGAPQFPADHANRPSDVCLACHDWADAPPKMKVPYFDTNAFPFFYNGTANVTFEPGAPSPAETTSSAGTTTPTTPTISGKDIFAAKCSACHSIGGGRLMGPDLKGVTSEREMDWLIRIIVSPDKLIAEGDPLIEQLVGEYGVKMPNMGVSEEEAQAMLDYIEEQSK